MQPRRRLILDNWFQLLFLLLAVVLANMLAARHFTRLDITRDRVHTLSATSRHMMGELDKPLLVKVYFTGGLEAPYNNHQQLLEDYLDEFKAFSRGRMEFHVVDPTGKKELEEEAQRFGVQPIQYRYRGSDRAELKRVYMGASFVYGERQAALEAITQVATLEYDVARTIRKLMDGDSQKVVGFTSGHHEVDIFTAQGPLQRALEHLADRYELVQIPLGGQSGVPDNVDALVMLGPQGQVSERARYQIDQFLMRGGALAAFLSNTRPDMRTLKPSPIYTNMETFLAHYGVVIHRDSVLDRESSGMLRVPVRQGSYTMQIPLNHPIVPKSTTLAKDSPVVRGLEQMMFPFASSLSLTDPLPRGVEAKVLARASQDASRVQGIRTLDPAAYQVTSPGEEPGDWPLMVSLVGSWESAFKGRPIPAPAGAALDDAEGSDEDESLARITDGALARLVVAGSADVVPNNISMFLNLVDWLVQDESLIAIRTKTVQLPAMEKPSGPKLRYYRALNAGGGILLLLLLGGGRWLLRSRSARKLEVER